MVKFCTGCGNELNENNRFCPKCGEKVDASELVMENNERHKKQGSEVRPVKKKRPRPVHEQPSGAERRPKKKPSREVAASKGTSKKKAPASRPSRPISSSSAQQQEFELKKKGIIINIIFIVIGMVSMYGIFSVLDKYVGSFISGGAAIYLGVSFLGTLIYYLPALLYHASVGGKLVMFLLCMFLGWTLIIWAILLFVVISKNKTYAYQQEMLHYQRNQIR